MPKINADLPEELNQKLKVHKAKNNFKKLPEALVDALEKFFEKSEVGK